MKLRPHHLLCVQKYTGSGYDDAFAANMESLIRRLAACPDTAVTLTEGRDDLCAACPHMAGGRCASEEKVNRLDRGVLEACGFSAGETRSWSALARTAGEQVLETDMFEKVCGDCEWFDLCRTTREGWIDGNEG
jgi:hypothetical protein